MNTRVNNPKRKSKKMRIIFSIILITISFLLLCFKKLNERNKYDLMYSEKIQKIFSEYQKNILLISKITNNFFLFLFLILFIDNYTNIFISFILIEIFSFCHYFSSIIKLTFNDKNPFFFKNEYKVHDCGIGWGIPCENIIIIIPFFFLLYDISTLNQRNIIFKIFYIIFSLIIILFNCLSLIINETYFLSQIIISLLIGYSIYQILCSFNFDYDNGHILYILLKHYCIYLLINILMILTLIISFIYSIKVNKDIKDKICIDDSKINYNDKNGNKIINEGSFISAAIFISNFFAYFSLKSQYILSLDNNKNYWFQFNFDELGISESIDNLSSGSIIIMKQTKWNNTSKIKSFIRFLLSIIISFICFLPYFYIDWNSNFLLIFFVKYLLSFFLFYFVYFFLLKIIFKKFHCINFTLFIQIDEKPESLLNYMSNN